VVLLTWTKPIYKGKKIQSKRSLKRKGEISVLNLPEIK
jgi:hypothetical protein